MESPSGSAPADDKKGGLELARGAGHRAEALRRPLPHTTSPRAQSRLISGVPALPEDNKYRQQRESKSALLGSRQPSEDSRTLRFTVNGGAPTSPNESFNTKGNWMRRLSVAPGLALREAGLSRIRVRGHLGHLQYGEILKRFERQSTFHGICHASLAPNKSGGIFWYTAFGICFLFLLVQVVFLVIKYREYKKTVDLDLKFENAPFPSITLCNLNPYKRSAIMQNPETKRR
ncbi:unnamed protein product, partial [Mesorhabditis spiculigera]